MIAAQSRSFIETPQPIGDAQLQVCWQAARCRLIDELRRIDACIDDESNFGNDAQPSESLWDRLAPLIEEVFATEMLTRVWSGVLAARDRLHPTCGYGAVARNILVLQLKVRQRALRLLVDGAPATKTSNASRRRTVRGASSNVGPICCCLSWCCATRWATMRAMRVVPTSSALIISKIKHTPLIRRPGPCSSPACVRHSQRPTRQTLTPTHSRKICSAPS